MRAAIYARKSKEEEDRQIESIPVQIANAKAFIAARGWELVLTETDEMSRAEFERRLGLQRITHAGKRRDFDVLVVRDDTRIGGEIARTLLALEGLLEAGVRVFTYDNGQEITLHSALDKIMLAVRAFGSESEREKCSSRTRDVLLEKARNGYCAGGRTYGYDNKPIMDGEKRLRVEYLVNAAEAEIVTEAWRRYYVGGEGVRSIASDFNQRGIKSSRSTTWSPSAIWALVRREMYVGVLVWQRARRTYKGGTRVFERRPVSEWQRFDAPHLRIVPPELEAIARERWATKDDTMTRRPVRRGRPPTHLLVSRARCACGGPIAAVRTRNGHDHVAAYTCGRHRDRGTPCDSRALRPVRDVDSSLINAIREHVLREDVVLAALARFRERQAEAEQTAGNEIPLLESEAATLEREVDRLSDRLTIFEDRAAAEPTVRRIEEKHARLRFIRARLAALRVAPSVIDLSVRRLDREARRRLRNLSSLLRDSPTEAGRMLDVLLAGPVQFTQIEVNGRPRFRFEARIRPGRLIQNVCDPTGI